MQKKLFTSHQANAKKSKQNRKEKKKMKFKNYEINFTTWTVWMAGLLVKDAVTLTFEKKETGEVFTTTAVINYSARGYGKMTLQNHEILDDRMLEKHKQYMDAVDGYRKDTIKPVLNALIGNDFKSINNFVRVYNGRY